MSALPQLVLANDKEAHSTAVDPPQSDPEHLSATEEDKKVWEERISLQKFIIRGSNRVILEIA